MPTLGDLYLNLDKNLKLKMFPFINGSLSFFNKKTNVKINNSLIIADIYELGEENIKMQICVYLEPVELENHILLK